MRRDVIRIDSRDDHAYVGNLCGVAAVAAHDSENGRSGLFRILQRKHKIRAHVALKVPAANGKYQYAIFRVQTAAFEPCGENGIPPFVIRARRQLRHVIGRGIGFEAAKLAEIVDCVAAFPALPPTPRMKSRPPRSRTAASRSTAFSRISGRVWRTTSETSPRNCSLKVSFAPRERPGKFSWLR